jgi:hypothetical protein
MQYTIIDVDAEVAATVEKETAHNNNQVSDITIEEEPIQEIPENTHTET